MSYIPCYNNNYYKPSKNLQDLFQTEIVHPFESTLPTVASQLSRLRELRNAGLDDDKNIVEELKHLSVAILDQGRANFNKPSGDFSAVDKMLLYCVFYMPIHLFSSYHVFRHNLTFVNDDNIVFIDFGCGPLTSGIAFWTFARQSNITYLGIDSAEIMLDKARAINQHGPNKYGGPFYSKARGISDYNQLPQLLDKYIKMADSGNTQIIFNFCYFLASKSLNIVNLSDVLISIVEKYGKHKICVVYQNPAPPIYHENWVYLKDNLSAFRNRATQSNVTRVYCDRLIQGKRQYADVYYDILYNY